MTDDQMMSRVLFLEELVQKWLRQDKYIGKNSRVFKVTQECHELWWELNKRDLSRRKGKNVIALNPYN